jgi:integrase
MNAETFVQWVGPEQRAADALAEDTLHDFIHHLFDDRGVCGSTVNRYIAALYVLIKFAGLVKPQLPRFRENGGRFRTFTEDETAAVEQVLSRWGLNRERDLFRFLLDTGARPYSEACSLHWRYVGDQRVTFINTKNGLDRTIPLTPLAWEAVQRQRKLGLKGPWTDISDWRMVNLWRKIREELPELKDTVLYTCRHSCASRQVVKGVDLYRVMHWMGHKSYQTTMGYAHLAQDHLKENLRALL